MNCSSNHKPLQILGLIPINRTFVGQNNFDNKIPFLVKVKFVPHDVEAVLLANESWTQWIKVDKLDHFKNASASHLKNYFSFVCL